MEKQWESLLSMRPNAQQGCRIIAPALPATRITRGTAEPLKEQPGSFGAAGSTESGEVERLRLENEHLRRDIRDYQIALLTSNEHGDLLEEHLYRLSTSLSAEIHERQAADEKLRQVIKVITKDKVDLEVLVQILIDQGDAAAAEAEKARIDGLTRIANRRRFDESLLSEWGRHLRMQTPLSLMICDVDHFKLYNDFYGHQAGDECLKSVAGTLTKCCGNFGLVARYGGEEFAILLLTTKSEAAFEATERVRSALATAAIPHPASPVSRYVTLSIGIATRTPRTAEHREMLSLIEEADRNLYLAKRRGRNQAAHSNYEEAFETL